MYGKEALEISLIIVLIYKQCLNVEKLVSFKAFTGQQTVVKFRNLILLLL